MIHSDELFLKLKKIWPNLPDNVTELTVHLSAGSLVTITTTFYIDKDVAEELQLVIKQFNLVESNLEIDS
jgi:hypothetical protein